MAREEPAPTAHISSAKGGQDPAKGSSKRQGKGRRKKDGQSAEPANAAPDSSAAAASIQAEDKPAPAPRTSRITYVPIARQSSADVDSAHGKDTHRQDKTPAKQPVRDRRSPRAAAEPGESTDAAGQQPGAKQKRGGLGRDKARRQARLENARKAWGQRGDGAAPATGLESSQGEGSSADCPVCWGECSHRDGRCPCLDHLPDGLLAEVWDLIGEYQRHYALTLIQRFWERSGHWPPNVPSTRTVRGERFCYSCDSQDHGAGDCPDLSGMDGYTRSCLIAAYRHGTFNGMTPGEIYTEWEDGWDPPKFPPCLACKSKTHCFEACSRTGHMRQDDFLRVVSALKAGQVQTAQEIWDAIQAGSKQMGSRRDGWTGQTSKKPVPVEQSHAQLPTAKVNPPGGDLAQSIQSDKGMPEPVTSERQPPQESPPSPVPVSLQDSWSTARRSALSPSLWAHASPSKPYWHEAARAATQGALSSVPPPNRQTPPENASASAASAAGQTCAPQQVPQTEAQPLLPPVTFEQPEATISSAAVAEHHQGLPPMPQQAYAALGLQSEQMQRSLAPRTMLVTPLAPSARRASASGQPSQSGSTARQCNFEQELRRPGSAVECGGPLQPGRFDQPGHPGSAAEMAQPSPPLGAQHLPSLHSMQLNAQVSPMQPASVSTGQHSQHGHEAFTQHDAPAAGGYRCTPSDGMPSMSARHSAGHLNSAQAKGFFQEGPLQGEPGQGTHCQHMQIPAGVAQQQQQQPGVSYHGATAASHATPSTALGIPAAHMRSMDITGSPGYAVVPSMAMHSSWTPPALCAPEEMLQQPQLHEQQDGLRQQQSHHVGLPVPFSHLGSMPAPMQAVQIPAHSLAEPYPASSGGSWQEQHDGAGMAPRRARAPPGFPQASQDIGRQLQEVPAQLQLPSWHEQQGYADRHHHEQHPLSHPQDTPMPWLPSALANHGPHVPAPNSRPPAPGPMHLRPNQPLKSSDGGSQGALPVSRAHEAPEQMPPVQQPGFAEALTAQWDMHSNSSSVAASPARPQGRSHPARLDGPPRRLAPLSAAASAASAQVQHHSDDSHKDIMALLLHGVHHVAQRPEVSSPRRSDCPASPGLSEAPRRSLSSSPAEPETEAEAETEMGVKGAWGKPLSTAVRAAPSAAPYLALPPRPNAPRPPPAPASAPVQAEAAAVPHLMPPATETPAARPAQAKGWTKVGKPSKGENSQSAVPDEAKKEGLRASPSHADSADDQNLEKAIKESLKMQAAGKSRQAARKSRSSAQAEADSAAGPGLQNDPGEYNCFLNVIVQCLWHCTAFRDAFLSLPRKVVQADEVLGELSTLFRGFGKLPPGSVGRRTLDPTGLRLALANLDPKRFAAGEMSDAAEVLNVVTERLDLAEEGRAMAQAVLGCHIREQMHCLRCGRDTRQKSYCQYLFTASASGLREQASVMRHGDEGDRGPVAGSAVIRELERRTTIKSCSTDEGGCGRRGPMQQSLEGRQPRAFALQLVWESLQEAGQDIRDTLELIQEGIDLGKVYSGRAGKRQYQPSIMVCYYGRHYHAFVHMDGQWRGFDDAASYVVGSWEELVHKCELGKIQPSVLFFQPT